MRVPRSIALVTLVIVACRGSEPPPTPPPAPVPARTPPPTPTSPVAVVPDFPAGTRSLELVRTVGVRLEAAADAKRIGTVAVDTRVGWTRTAKGRGCDRPWVEIVPHGWVCGDHVKPSKKPPHGQEVPQLDRGEIVPGIYGKVTAANAMTYTLEQPDRKKRGRRHAPIRSPAELDPKVPHMLEASPVIGSLNVRQYDEITLDGKAYWKVAQKDNQYVLASTITGTCPVHLRRRAPR